MIIAINPIHANLYGNICIILGIGLLILRSRRKFYRRNSAGIEEYKNYTSAVGNGCLNKLMKLSAFFLLLMGIVFKSTGCSERKAFATQQEKNQKSN